MTSSSPPPEAPSGTACPADTWHRHDRRCYWDHTRCGWVCPPAGAVPPVDPAVPVPELVAEPASRTPL